MNRASKIILFVSSIVASAALAAYGQNITGNLGTTGVSYGSPLALQTINTGFGDSAGNNDSAGGSELDAVYDTVDPGWDLLCFLAGNYENNGNHLDIFIQTSSGGQSTLNISGGWTASAMNGSLFPAGFAPTLMLDANDYQGTLYVDQYVLSGSGSANTYLGSITGSPLGIYSQTTLGNITLALNNNNASSMNSGSGNAFGGPYATTGLELKIPLADYGYTGGPVEMMAVINGGNDGYLSNQALPGLPVGTQNIASGGVIGSPIVDDFSFVVVPEPSSISLVVVGLLGVIGLIRRRK
jgi:hypothetical protein